MNFSRFFLSLTEDFKHLINYEGSIMKKFVFLYLCLTVLAVSLSSISAQENTHHSNQISKTILVTFSVNMELERLAGYFHPATDTVSIDGNFNAWEKSVMTVSQSNADIYSTTISVTDSVQDTIRFNFVYSPDVWEIVGVREYVITQTNYDSGVAVLDTIGFNSESLSPPIRVEFRCNMTIEMRNKEFVRGEKVFVRGDFNGWSGNDFELKDIDGDSIYSRIFYNFKADQKLTFKFTNNHDGKDNWESCGNSTLTVSLYGINVFEACWESCIIDYETKTIQVTFSVNMKTEKKFPTLFDPLVNSVSVRGSFNGWGETRMTPLVDSADIYRVVVPIEAMFDEKISFKFFYSQGTWEVNNLTDKTQNDRYFIVNQTIFDSASFSFASYFNNDTLRLPDLLQDSHITFTCNTNGASIVNAPAGTEFKTIHMAGGTPPTEWPNSGWPDADINKVIQLYDDGTHEDKIAGDKIFTCELQFAQYHKYSLQYRYAANWGLLTNGGSNDNETVGGLNKTFIWNYLTATAEVKDTFGIVHTTDVTKVEKTDNIIPNTFKLEQNYPNPFNPETSIQYSVVSTQNVVLKVFDVLGDEVAVLVNEEQSAGTYQVNFNTQLTTNNKQLSSGIYFYQLRAGDFVQTKKMILLR